MLSTKTTGYHVPSLVLTEPGHVTIKAFGDITIVSDVKLLYPETLCEVIITYPSTLKSKMKIRMKKKRPEISYKTS